jgi:FkbM family methyltransferase
MELGTVDRWTCEVDHINSASVVVCAGVGLAITFERALVDHTGCRILVLDPSPTGIETMAQPAYQNPRIVFMPIGLAGQDGPFGFAPPDQLAEGFWKAGTRSGKSVFPCRSISSLMKEHGWEHIDLLKMDIEGFEYAVLDDILSHRLDVRQICVELHYDKQIDIPQTRLQLLRYILRMLAAGYRLVHWTNAEFTFVRPALRPSANDR